jgi:hypothetical protein
MSVYAFLALKLAALAAAGSVFALVVSRIRKRGPRATIYNILLAILAAAIVDACFLLFFFAPVLGLLVAAISIVGTTIFIVRTRPTWSQVRTDLGVAVAFVVVNLIVLGITG